MANSFQNSLPATLATLGAVGSLASIFGLPEPLRWLSAVACVAATAGAIGFHVGRSRRTPRDSTLDRLGFTRAYETAKEDDALLSGKVAAARKVRVLAVNAEMLFRNLPTPFKEGLKQGLQLEVLVCDPSAPLVADMERMELQDGREPGRSIADFIRDTEPTLRGLLLDATSELPKNDHTRLGQIRIGYFTTQYRETMIICDDEWVWWTPHLNPARGAERPTFVLEGKDSKYVRMCVRHFCAIQAMCSMRSIAGAT